MNKQIFSFHFWAAYDNTCLLPRYLTRTGKALEYLVFYPLCFLAVTSTQESLFAFEITPKNLFLFAILAFGQYLFAGIAGAYAGLKALYDFRGYDTISRSPGYRAFMLTPEDREFKQHCAKDIPKDKERIIASANTDSKGNVWAVLRPGRHHHVIWYMADHGCNKDSRQQGFLTNKYRFLGRQDALKLAGSNGQAPNPAHHRDLFSEDLWATPPHLAQKE